MFKNFKKVSMKDFKKGFTLIELLVVVAIIGILSTVVLGNLNAARSKGSDAAVKSTLASMRVQGEVFYNDNDNSYGTFSTGTGTTCPIDVNASTTNMFEKDTVMVNALKQVGTNAISGSVVNCVSTPNLWAISVNQLKGDAAAATTTNAAGWCVDNSGYAGKSKISIGTSLISASSTTCNQ
ncbi:MAG: prepilin-type N-terminal cleavage/methylation domain-containing protein [Patescibacteria group bacterium]